MNFPPVDEERSPGVLVARVIASDMDQEMSDNSRIDYIITAVSGTPAPGAAVQPSVSYHRLHTYMMSLTEWSHFLYIANGSSSRIFPQCI